jgi:hypothetical protein
LRYEIIFWKSGSTTAVLNIFLSISLALEDLPFYPSDIEKRRLQGHVIPAFPVMNRKPSDG